MTKRPKVMSLDDLAGSIAAEPVEPPTPAPVEQPPAAPARRAVVQLEHEQADDPAIVSRTPRKRTARAKPPAEPVLRTTHYMRRPVHDVLREIAFKERRKVSDLINEGLDRMLRSRGYPPLDEIWQHDAEA